MKTASEVVGEIIRELEEENRRLRAERITLRTRLTVLAAAWGSNAEHDSAPGAASAWRDASSRIDALLKTD